MGERFRITVFGEPRGEWQASFKAAIGEAVRLDLASWDDERREWFIAFPVSIQREHVPDAHQPPGRSRDRHRDRWNAEDIARLRAMAREGETVAGAAARTGRTQEAIARRARLHGIELTRARRR